MTALDALLIRIRPNLAFTPDPIQDEQLGLLYIATYCNRNGYNVKVLDESAPTLDLILRTVREAGCEVVGFFCDHENIMTINKVAQRLRAQKPELLMVAGGPQASAWPWDERILNETEIDIVAKGEGEETFLELLNFRLRSTGRLEDIDGIAYQENGSIHHTRPREVERNLDKYPMPDRDLNFHGNPINGSENIITSRGCPFFCTFCYEGRRIKVRRRSPENVLEEIEFLLKNRNMYYLAILDDVFTMSTKHVFQICDGIRSLQDKYHRFFWFCEGRADILCKHPKMLESMQKAGLIRLQIGVETGSQKVLDAYNKKLTIEEVRDCVGLCYEHDILSVVGNFIIGGALESLRTLEQSIDFACELMEIAPGCYDFNTTIYTPYPGTPMYSTPELFGMTILDPDCVTGPGDNYAFCATEEMSKWAILDARHVFMDAVERKAASLLPRVSDARRLRHFHVYYLIHMHTIWVQLLARDRNFFNYYGLQVSGDKISLNQIKPDELAQYKPVRTVNIGASHEETLVLQVNGKTLKFSKLGEKIFEYCYGKLTVDGIVGRIKDETGLSDSETVERYVRNTLAWLDSEKLVVFSPI